MSWLKILSKQHMFSMLFVGYVVIFLSVSHGLVPCISSSVWVKPCKKKNMWFIIIFPVVLILGPWVNWSSGWHLYPWQGIETKWSLMSLPAQDLLWFYDSDSSSLMPTTWTLLMEVHCFKLTTRSSVEIREHMWDTYKYVSNTWEGLYSSLSQGCQQQMTGKKMQD